MHRFGALSAVGSEDAFCLGVVGGVASGDVKADDVVGQFAVVGSSVDDWGVSELSSYTLDDGEGFGLEGGFKAVEWVETVACHPKTL